MGARCPRRAAPAQGRSDEALVHFVIQQSLLSLCGIADVDLSPTPELVELRLRAGAITEANELAATYHKQAAEKGLPWALARAARIDGLLAAESEMDLRFEQALVAHNQTPDRFETARTQLAYGSRLRRGRQRIRAREQLRAAVETFDQLGAGPWAAPREPN